MSLFASSGIRIQKPSHEYLTSVGRSTNPPWDLRPTHDAVWELWSKWCGTKNAEELFADKLRIHPSVPLRVISKCLTSLVASKSLKDWGFDLVQLGDDHTARNNASYKPTWSTEPRTRMTAQDAEYLKYVWQLLQPTSVGLQFELSYVHYLIDLELENFTTDAAFNSAAWYQRLANTIAAETGASEYDLFSILQDRSSSTALFKAAGNQKTDWQNVMSRALFLLRLASKGAEVGFSYNAHSSGKNWFRHWLQHAGLLSSTGGVSPADLWEDFCDLPTASMPGSDLPDAFRTNYDLSAMAMRLGRPDASLAWSLGI